MNQTVEPSKNRILIIDDNPSIHEDIRKILRAEDVHEGLAQSKAALFGEEPAHPQRTSFEIDSAFQGQEGLEKVQQAEAAGRPYALAFVDVRMPPGWDGVETINRIWQKHTQLQVVICTAYSDYSWEQMIQRIGKSDSLVILKKPFDNIEVLQLAHAMTEKWRLSIEVKGRLQHLDILVNERTSELQEANTQLRKEISERMLLEDALRLSEERFSKAFKASPIPLAIQSLEVGKYVDVNQGFLQLTGYSQSELIGHTMQELSLWDDPSEGTTMLRLLQEQMSVRNMPCRLRTKSQGLRQVLLSVELFELEGKPYTLIIAQDITDQMALEDQLRQSQKMEAVGQLAAGVAHDFNNILTVVQGHVGLVLDGQEPESKDRPSLQAVLVAADRASKLIRQLLAFSRKQVIQMRPISVHQTLSGLKDMLPRVLSESILVKVQFQPDLPQINADSGMMDQMLMNLVVNGRDAMPDGGVLTVSAELMQLDANAARVNPDARPGQFIRLSVADTGCGIPSEHLPRIFEPFYTTKPVGKGTGLGLAAVYGIARQHGGWVEVQSQVDNGSVFHIFIPTLATARPPNTPPKRSSAPGGRETILVAEDDEDVRDFVVALLKAQGYKVIAANSGVEALEWWKKATNEKIDLLFTDMVMPGGYNGRQLAEKMLEKDSSLRVLYTSGYNPGMAGKDFAWPEGHDFLEKPYEPAKLIERVRASLDRS